MSRSFTFFYPDHLFAIRKYAMKAFKNCPGFNRQIGIILIIKNIFKAALPALRLACLLRLSYGSCHKGANFAGFTGLAFSQRNNLLLI
jgi:hypothetical protein